MQDRFGDELPRSVPIEMVEELKHDCVMCAGHDECDRAPAGRTSDTAGALPQ